MRIAIGGIAVECCTFSPLLTRMEDFSIARGTDLLALYPFLNRYTHVEFVPLVRARATPGGAVETRAYEAIKDEFLEGLRLGMPWDGVYLDLHGAMSVVGMQDAEGDWIAGVRDVVGPDCLLAASYDLHGNVSQRVVDHLDILTAYRTAPHVDVEETRRRAVKILLSSLTNGIRPSLAFVPVPLLLPGERAMTTAEPARTIYTGLSRVIAQFGLIDASLLVGYAWADEPRVGASVITVGSDPELARDAAEYVASICWNHRADFEFGMKTGSVDECIAWAQAAAKHATPVFISDAGDNITGGGVGDVPFVLERMLIAGVRDAVYAALFDPQSVEICFEVGGDVQVDLSLGGKIDRQHGQPLRVSARVLLLDEHDPGNRQVVLQVDGVKVILTERRTAFTTLEQFERLGIDVKSARIVAVKLGYLFPELAQVAATAFLANSPGAINPAVETLDYHQLRRPIYPLDMSMTWEANVDTTLSSGT
jgi:microcystin degradation protein MlrC